MSSFAKQLRLLRIERGLTQNALSKVLGLSRAAVGMYECGTREPSLEILMQISNFFNVSVDFLIGNTDKVALGANDFTYSLYNETQKLTAENKQKLLEMALFFQQQQEKGNK